MSKILVAFTTNAGTTVKVAQAVGEELSKNGAAVEVRRLEEVTTLEPYTAVIVGAPMIVGWHRAATNFVKKNQAALGRVPVAYFFTAMSLTRPEETSIDGVPLCVDPKLAKAPKRPGHLSFRERYATAANYLRPVLKAAPGIKPVSAAFFSGRLEMSKLKWWQALFVLFVIQVQPGGSHNLPFIRSWAAEVRTQFGKAER